MKCPNEQFCRIRAAFWGILSIKKSFGLENAIITLRVGICKCSLYLYGVVYLQCG